MTRVKGGVVSKNRRRKVLKRAKGYFGSKHRLYKTAQEQLFHSGAYSYNDRKKRANDFRKLWITRINAACRNNDIVYSKFISGLKKAPKKEKETVEKKVEKTVETKKDYSKLTVAELKAECQKNGIEVKSTMKKADLVEALSK